MRSPAAEESSPHFSMLKWPNTPSKERYLQALRATTDPGTGQHDQPPRATPALLQEDALHLQNCIETPDYQEEVEELIKQVCKPGARLANIQHILVNITMTAESPTTIGLTLLKHGQDQNPHPHQNTFISTRLQRHKDWMGLNSSLPHLKNLQVRIYESKSLPGQPGAAVALPTWSDGKPPRYTLPKGHPQDLKQLFIWHGASVVHWVPIYRWD